MRSSYDEVLYPGLPYSQTHPSRLATLATLHGMDPAPIENCRVLELACGDGGNLIPMAFDLPGSQFLGIDYAEAAIRAGREEIALLGLGNIRLEAMNVMDAGPGLGRFDYIIAHGFYSWVPEPVRRKIMELVKAVLAPQGVSYISYNALPGCRIREMLREMMRFHVREATEPAARLEGARELLQWFTESYCGPGVSRGFLVDEAQNMLERKPQFLYHDELSDNYVPFYFQDFVAQAGQYGLQYLSESNYADTQPGKIPQAIVAKVNRICGGDQILREQYFDMLKCRMFRHTLLCHKEVNLPAEPVPERLCRLAAASPAKPVNAKPDLRPGVAEEFSGVRGSATTAYPLAKAALLLLRESWPAALPFNELLARASQLVGEEPDPTALAEILLATYSAGVIELHAQPPHCVPRAGRFPTANSLVRSLAARGKLITTPRHSTVEACGDVERRLLILMDGTRDLPALARELQPFLNQPQEEVVRGIETNLEILAEAGLLTA